jgi:thiol-disulfide isomerase/thioredoxin
VVSSLLLVISVSSQAKPAKKPVPIPTAASLSQDLTQTLTLASMQQPINPTPEQSKEFLSKVAVALGKISSSATTGESSAKTLDDKCAYALVKFESDANAAQDAAKSLAFATTLIQKYRESTMLCTPLEELILPRYLDEKGLKALKPFILQSKNPEVLSSFALSEMISDFIGDKADINDLKFLNQRFPNTNAGKRAGKMFEFRSQLSLNRPMPDFELEMMNGQKGKLSQLRGKVVMVHFWGFWNPASLEETGQLRAIEKSYPKDFVILGVNTDPWTKGFLTTKMKEAGISWSNHFAGRPSGRLPIDLGIKEYPSKIIVDKDGIVRYLPGLGSWRDAVLKYL